MVLPNTKAELVNDRRDEIVGTKDDEFLKVISYNAYDTFPEVKPHKGKPENIRFLRGGVEALIKVTSSSRAVGGSRTLESSPIDTTYIFQLIDEDTKKVLKYSIDAGRGEY